jgi:hypothetical protein
MDPSGNHPDREASLGVGLGAQSTHMENALTRGTQLVSHHSMVFNETERCFPAAGIPEVHYVAPISHPARYMRGCVLPAYARGGRLAPVSSPTAVSESGGDVKESAARRSHSHQWVRSVEHAHGDTLSALMRDFE